MESEENAGSEQPSSSNAGKSIALRRMMEEEFEPIVINSFPRLIRPMVINTVNRVLTPMVIKIVQQIIKPVVEDLFRRVVKEEIQEFEAKLLAGGRLNLVEKERLLRLMFVGEVPSLVQTGQDKGIKGDTLKVVLIDETGQTVTTEPESCAKVEIVLLDAGGDDDVTHENFEGKIIGEEEKKKPHFAKNVYLCLKNGVGDLAELNLAHGKLWTRTSNCRLGVRMVQKFRGIVVQEAWTAPFKVEDKRGKQYSKHDNPFLSSDVWRLRKIARDRKPCKRLKKKNITTVQDFRFWLSVDPEGLKEIVDADALWKTTVAHSLTCIVNDEKLYLYKSSTQPQPSLIYNTVGELKGVVTDECRFVPIDNLSSEKKDHARELLKGVLLGSTFEQRYKTIFNTTEAAPPLVQEVLYGSTDINASTNSSTVNESNLSTHVAVHQTTEPGCSHPIMSHGNLTDLPPAHTDPQGYLHPEPAGKSSSRVSNTSFQSVGSTIEHGSCRDDFFGELLAYPCPTSPNPMFEYAIDAYSSYNTDVIYEHRNELHDDEGIAANAEPLKVVETSIDTLPETMKRKLSRMLSSIREKMCPDHKKNKVG